MVLREKGEKTREFCAWGRTSRTCGRWARTRTGSWGLRSRRAAQQLQEEEQQQQQGGWEEAAVSESSFRGLSDARLKCRARRRPPRGGTVSFREPVTPWTWTLWRYLNRTLTSSTRSCRPTRTTATAIASFTRLTITPYISWSCPCSLLILMHQHHFVSDFTRPDRRRSSRRGTVAKGKGLRRCEEQASEDQEYGVGARR